MRNSSKKDWIKTVKEAQVISRRDSLLDALKKLDDTALGILLMVDKSGRLERTITDGDLRRLLLSRISVDTSLGELPEKKPITITSESNPESIIGIMNQYGVNQVPVVTSEFKIEGVVYRKDIDTKILLSTPHLGEIEYKYINNALETNWVAPVGPNIDLFEEEVAEKVGSKKAVALSSGTAAIHLALSVIGVEKGDYVFCSSFTFVASANPIIYMGATPVFIDSDPETWNMSANALEKALVNASKQGKLPKAIVVVNIYGQSADYDKILKLCKEYNVIVIEDAAESLGATYKGRYSGTLGDLGVFSFNGNKIITTSGGGMLVSDNTDWIEKAKYLSTQAREPVLWYEHESIGYNYRLSNILAGIGRGQLSLLDERVEARRNIFRRYKELLEDVNNISWMPEAGYGKSTHWLSAAVLNVENIDITSLVQDMSQNGIEIRHVWKPLHQQQIFKHCDYYPYDKDFSFSDSLFGNAICLPSSSHLTNAQQEKVGSTLKKLLEKYL